MGFPFRKEKKIQGDQIPRKASWRRQALNFLGFAEQEKKVLSAS